MSEFQKSTDNQENRMTTFFFFRARVNLLLVLKLFSATIIY